MPSVEVELREELERLAPYEGSEAADWNEVRRRAEARLVQGSRRYRLGRRAGALGVAVAIAAVVAVPSLALSSDLRRFLGLDEREPERVEPVLRKARLLVEAPAGDGLVARVFTAPASRGGGRCWFVERVPSGSPPRATSANGGGRCSLGEPATPPSRGEMTWGLSMQPKTRNNVRGWKPPVLDGWVNPRLGATRVVLEWNGGSQELAFANDHFVFVSQALLFNPPKENLPYDIVAYDDEWRELARTRIFKDALYTD